eukprot:1157871-Pelagomonas_calceolata.AAC.5
MRVSVRSSACGDMQQQSVTHGHTEQTAKGHGWPWEKSSKARGCSAWRAHGSNQCGWGGSVFSGREARVKCPPGSTHKAIRSTAAFFFGPPQNSVGEPPHPPLPPTLHSGHSHSCVAALRAVDVSVRQRLWYAAGQPSQQTREPPMPHSTHSLTLSSPAPDCTAGDACPVFGDRAQHCAADRTLVARSGSYVLLRVWGQCAALCSSALRCWPFLGGTTTVMHS